LSIGSGAAGECATEGEGSGDGVTPGLGLGLGDGLADGSASGETESLALGSGDGDTADAGVASPASNTPTHTPETTNDNRRAATRTPPHDPPGRDARWHERSVPAQGAQ
jgi:hypothetical protein